jgi:ABC-type transporter Mla subunit MlaD
MTSNTGERINSVLPLLSALAALLYVVGFLVLAAHYSRLRIFYIDEFHLAYLMAAALFVVCNAVPTVAAVLMSRNFGKASTRLTANFSRRPVRILIAGLYWLFLLVGVGLS